MLNKIINNMVYMYILIILLKKLIVLDFELNSLFFKLIKHFCTYVNKFLKDGKISGNFAKKFY